MHAILQEFFSPHEKNVVFFRAPSPTQEYNPARSDRLVRLTDERKQRYEIVTDLNNSGEYDTPVNPANWLLRLSDFTNKIFSRSVIRKTGKGNKSPEKEGVASEQSVSVGAGEKPPESAGAAAVVAESGAAPLSAPSPGGPLAPGAKGPPGDGGERGVVSGAKSEQTKDRSISPDGAAASKTPGKADSAKAEDEKRARATSPAPSEKAEKDADDDKKAGSPAPGEREESSIPGSPAEALRDDGEGPGVDDAAQDDEPASSKVQRTRPRPKSRLEDGEVVLQVSPQGGHENGGTKISKTSLIPDASYEDDDGEGAAEESSSASSSEAQQALDKLSGLKPVSAAKVGGLKTAPPDAGSPSKSVKFPNEAPPDFPPNTPGSYDSERRRRKKERHRTSGSYGGTSPEARDREREERRAARSAVLASVIADPSNLTMTYGTFFT